MYMAGFFPVMMFGLPAAALAMYHTAKDNKKKAIAGLLLAAGLASFFTGVTEPLEFAFMFLAPGLYVVHAVLTGITFGVVAALPVRAGFNFSDWFSRLGFKVLRRHLLKSTLVNRNWINCCSYILCNI